jgi:hypothetical protein
MYSSGAGTLIHSQKAKETANDARDTAWSRPIKSRKNDQPSQEGYHDLGSPRPYLLHVRRHLWIRFHATSMHDKQHPSSWQDNLPSVFGEARTLER